MFDIGENVHVYPDVIIRVKIGPQFCGQFFLIFCLVPIEGYLRIIPYVRCKREMKCQVHFNQRYMPNAQKTKGGERCDSFNILAFMENFQCKTIDLTETKYLEFQWNAINYLTFGLF